MLNLRDRQRAQIDVRIWMFDPAVSQSAVQADLKVTGGALLASAWVASVQQERLVVRSPDNVLVRDDGGTTCLSSNGKLKKKPVPRPVDVEIRTVEYMSCSAIVFGSIMRLLWNAGSRSSGHKSSECRFSPQKRFELLQFVGFEKFRVWSNDGAIDTATDSGGWLDQVCCLRCCFDQINTSVARVLNTHLGDAGLQRNNIDTSVEKLTPDAM